MSPRGLCNCPCHTSVETLMHMVPCCDGDEGGLLSRQLAKAPEMYDLLKELEWSITFFITSGSCPSCSYGKRDGHADDCKLAAVLKAVEGET